MKYAGCDAIVIDGKAEKPVYLWISDGKEEIRDAGHLWGKSTAECTKAIREELGDHGVRVAQISPAGKKQVSYSCVMNDMHHAAGRTGMGAVMGSKNLKAIAVRGHASLEMVRRYVHYASTQDLINGKTLSPIDQIGVKKLRDELLYRVIFTILIEAKLLIEQWRGDYNQVRPHSSLGYRPPAPEAVIPLNLT